VLSSSLIFCKWNNLQIKYNEMSEKKLSEIWELVLTLPKSFTYQGYQGIENLTPN